MAGISRETGRQIGLVISRSGEILNVIVGDTDQILLPDLTVHSLGRGKLRSVRVVHTHLKPGGLTTDDLADLKLLRLDLMVALDVDRDGKPATVHAAHLLPPNPQNEAESRLPPADFADFRLDFAKFIEALGEEIATKQETTVAVKEGQDKAIIVHVSTHNRAEIEERLAELRELCRTASITVAEEVVQRPRGGNARYVAGEGKLKEITASALSKGVDLIIFDQELTPAQSRSIAEITGLRVIDRTQLILDIFARRANSPDGKVQVELAQLRYILPRLAGKGTEMSRLMGGVGGRGPGESKLELDRRRVRTKLQALERRLKTLSQGRAERRKRRGRASVPIVSIVGYTNAGKSTLLNALTASEVFTENLLFATLDTASRRLRFPREREVIITDTVGFLRDLPEGLVGAFKATLEELEDADLLLHVIDVSNPGHETHIKAVEKLLEELGLSQKPILAVFNKADLLENGEAQKIASWHRGLAVAAKKPATLTPLMEELEKRFWSGGDAFKREEPPEQPDEDESNPE